MTTGSKYTREEICAYIDGEMTEEHVDRIEQAMLHNARLRDDINVMREIRGLYRSAYRNTDTKTSIVKRINRAHNLPASFLAIAASLLIVVGLSAGWLLQSPAIIQPATSDNLKSFYSLQEFVHASVNDKTTNAILRIEKNPAQLIATLDDIEQLLLKYEQNNRTLNLEIIVHSSALNILRADITPAGQRIKDLMTRYDNLTFLACNKTIRRLKEDKGIEVTLLPGVEVVPSALEQVLKRIQEKWVYVDV